MNFFPNLRSRIGWSVLTLLILSFCVSAPQQRVVQRSKFIEFQKQFPDKIWSPTLNEKSRQAVAAFKAHLRLNNGLEYGASVRNFHLTGKTAQQIDEELNSLKCSRKEDYLKDPKNQEPLLDQKGKRIPMDTYLCPDGGVVRVKAQGDSTSRFRPQPHASKSLRYPFDAPFLTFDDERVKVDDQGDPIPKWTKDLNQVYADSAQQKEFIEGWAEDAHVDLDR